MITWFQNRRAKLKREVEELKNDLTAAKNTTSRSPISSELTDKELFFEDEHDDGDNDEDDVVDDVDDHNNNHECQHIDIVDDDLEWHMEYAAWDKQHDFANIICYILIW